MSTGTPSSERLPSPAASVRPVWTRASGCCDALAFLVLVGVPVTYVEHRAGGGISGSLPVLATTFVAAVLYVGVLKLLGIYRRFIGPSLVAELRATVMPVAVAVLAAAAIPLGSAMSVYGLVAVCAAIPLLVSIRGGLHVWLTASRTTRTPSESIESDQRQMGVAEAASRDEAQPALTSAEAMAMISHDLRTPLTTLRAVGELALDEDLDAAERQRLLAIMARQAIRLDDLTQELLDTFRLQEGRLQLQREDVSLASLCDEVAEEVARTTGRRNQVTVRVDLVEPVLADRLKLRSVVRNLLTNAIKHTQDGKEVTIVARRSVDEVLVSIADSGEGIAAEHLPYLFDRFYRVAGPQSAAGGVGLGLFAARALVQAHGGRIWAESAGGGSCFTFSLPIARPVPPLPKGGAAAVSQDAVIPWREGPVAAQFGVVTGSQAPRVSDAGRSGGVATL